MNWELVVVGVIVAAAVAWAVRGLVRATKRKQVCTSCASSGGCPVAEGKTERALSSECVTLETLEPREAREP
jgi:hypothetical protein